MKPALVKGLMTQGLSPWLLIRIPEDEMVGWYHRLDAHELEQAPGDGEGQGSLAC